MKTHTQTRTPTHTHSCECLQCGTEVRMMFAERPCHCSDIVSSADCGPRLPGCLAILEMLPISTVLMPADINISPIPLLAIYTH